MDAFGALPLSIGGLIQPSMSSCKAVLYINTVNYNTTQSRQHTVSDWEVVFVYLTARLSADSLVLTSPLVVTRANPNLSSVTGVGIVNTAGGSGLMNHQLSMTLTMNDTTFSIRNSFSINGYTYYSVTAFIY